MTEVKEEITNELEHLAKLLDDENDFVYSNIKDRFVFHGKKSVDFLKQFTRSDDLLVSNRAKEIISILSFDELELRFKEVAERNDKNLLEDAMFLLAFYGYPDTISDNYKMILDKMAMDIENLIYQKDYANSSPIDIINVFNEYLFDEKGFMGNTDNYYDSDNSYMNKVIDRKTGIPVTISVLYLLLAKRLNLPIFGINLPSHFIIKYQDTKEEFYIDPFNKGIVISKTEAVHFLEQLGISKDDFNSIPFLKIAEDKEIFLRVLTNLINLYEKQNDTLRATQLKRVASHFEK
jgi:regulator of sirC expression with transglutaminase-like and TPR domain